MTEPRLRVLILGGYGVFGSRLARLLADADGLTIVVAGRSLAKANEVSARLQGGGARVSAAVFDRDGNVDSQLAAISPDIVVDASGPFQDYGAAPYRVVEATIAQGIDYLDLADGADFVTGIAAFDAAARSRQVSVLAGASSFPVLTAAAVRKLAEGLAQVDTITAGIAPSPYAGVGLNVIRAIASYAGKPLRLWRDGREATGHALTDVRRATIGPPGALPLHNRLFSLVDVPDLRLLPPLWPGLTAIWNGAAPVPEVLHRALIGLAWLVRLGVLPGLARLAPLFHRAANTVCWGEHRGGMFVAIEGRTAAGARIARTWHLIAEGDDGPLIPAMAAAAIVRRRLAGVRPAVGARPAVADLELADYEPVFADRAIVTGIAERSDAQAALPLYRRLLGNGFARLPPALQAMHDVRGTLHARGRADVEGGNPVARVLARALGFPPTGTDVPVEVTITAGADGGETWRRQFGVHTFSSLQIEGRGRADRLIVERFGPIAVGLALVVREGRLDLVVRRWTCFGLPLPVWLAPRAVAFESAPDGRFRFDVDIAMPVIGRLVGYRGWLQPTP